MNERLQDKLGLDDLVDDKLLQEAFSASPPEPGWPRLRVPGDPRNPTVASHQRGAVSLGLGCTWVIRNPATHETAEWSPQEALVSPGEIGLVQVYARKIYPVEHGHGEIGAR